MKKNQVTCVCGAYDFPHRIGGGNCSGSAWCASFNELDSSMCDQCNCFDNNECQAATGQESFKHGDCYEHELRQESMKDKFGNLPIIFDEAMEIQRSNHYR